MPELLELSNRLDLVAQCLNSLLMGMLRPSGDLDSRHVSRPATRMRTFMRVADPDRRRQDLPSGSWLTSTARIERVEQESRHTVLPRLQQEAVKGESEGQVETLLLEN